MAAAPASRLVVHAALAGNLLVALTKFAAAFWTGSSAMLSEAIHSTVDTADQVVLLYGLSRAERPPDALHPLGYGRELYFWSFIVALLMFTLGAGVTAYEGIAHIFNPHPIENALVAYFVLAAAFVFEGTSWYFALREFKRAKGDVGYFEAMRRSKDPPTFIVLFEDSAALVGLLIALLGTFFAQRLDMPVLDGVASLGIALVLSATALVLAIESKGLLIGEPASPDLRRAIMRTASSIDGIERAQIVFTVHMAPDQVVVALSLEFRDTMTAPDIEAAIDALEDAIQARHPEVIAVFVKPEDKVDQIVLPGRFPGRSRRLSGRTGGSATSTGQRA
ncbi:MAG TPA: cation diffusion facilitator family transporter [Pseudolabrys sp.]|jgi:cation diffusion facilitator family transporter|nr:cation diffusion facilitator family transporter [Pseudolabrys sp.]